MQKPIVEQVGTPWSFFNFNINVHKINSNMIACLTSIHSFFGKTCIQNGENWTGKLLWKSFICKIEYSNQYKYQNLCSYKNFSSIFVLSLKNTPQKTKVWLIWYWNIAFRYLKNRLLLTMFEYHYNQIIWIISTNILTLWLFLVDIPSLFNPLNSIEK